MKKYIQRIAIILFLTVLSATGVFTAFGKKKTYSEFEKRELAKAPEVSLSRIAKGTFQSDLDAYLSDHIVFRDQYVALSTIAGIAAGKREQNGVYFGSDGYLIEKYSDSDFDRDTVRENVRYLCRFANLAAKNLPDDCVKIAMIPGKGDILKDKLPAFAQTSKMNGYMERLLKSRLKNPDVYVNLGKALSAHSDEYIYFRTDHHWTGLGALYGYQALMKSMNIKPAESFPSETVTDDFRGTTFNKIHYAPRSDTILRYDVETADNCMLEYDVAGEITARDSMYDASALKTDDQYNYFLGGNYGVVKIHTGCTNKKTLVLVKDSFANCMVPYLTCHFENIVMIDLRYLNSSIFDTLNSLEQMDAVVMMFNEEKFMQDSHLWLLE